MRASILVVVAFLATIPAVHASIGPVALDQLHDLRATSLGVDRDGALWAWDGGLNVVVRLTAEGKRSESGALPDARSADVDAERGIALLDGSGRSILITSWTGKVVQRVTLPNEAATICWMDGQRVAVSPLYAPHRAEVWDVQRGVLERSLGTAAAIPRQRGARPAHATLLRYDPRRHELITLDGYDGTFTAFDANGNVTRQTSLHHPDRPQTDAWLSQLDAQNRRTGESFVPTIWSYTAMSVTGDGTVWLGESNDAASVTVVKIDLKGSAQRITVKSPDCPSVRVGVWQQSFIFYRDPKSPQPRCVGVRRQ